MPPKPPSFSRVDASLDVERFANQARIAEEQRIISEEAERKRLIIYNSPKAVAKREKDAIKAKEKEGKWLEKWWAKNDREVMINFIKKPTGIFRYNDHVVVSNPIDGCGGIKEHEEYKGKTGVLVSQNDCRCFHAVSKTCYRVVFDGDAEKTQHHFEECELEKI
jgi:hypothetical protein